MESRLYSIQPPTGGPIANERGNKLHDFSRSLSIVRWKYVFDGIPKASTARRVKAKQVMFPECRPHMSLRPIRISLYEVTKTIPTKPRAELLICCRRRTSCPHKDERRFSYRRERLRPSGRSSVF